MFSVYLKDTPSRNETVPSLFGERKDAPVQGLMPWALFSTPGLQQIVCSNHSLASSVRLSCASLPRQFANHVPLLLEHYCLLQMYQALVIAVSWEKSDLKPTQGAQYLRMLLDTSKKGVSHLLLDRQI